MTPSPAPRGPDFDAARGMVELRMNMEGHQTEAEFVCATLDQAEATIARIIEQRDRALGINAQGIDRSPPEETQQQMVDQKGPGDCFTACLASLTGIPLDDFPSQPRVRERGTEVDYNNAIQSLLISRGWMKVTTWRRPPLGYAIASGPSPRDPAISHCVIALNGEHVHDPHPDKIGIGVVEEYEVLIPLAPSVSPSVPKEGPE